jgi:TPP-dependent pyruvate/acetoin dehydrogenase alpha subunit
MLTDWDKTSLVRFEAEIADLFNSGGIKAPVHLSDGNEEQLLDVFAEVKNDDWIFCSWRSHYQCLLKGVPEELVVKSIVEGRSIALCFPEYRVFSSAIVGGQLSIAVGTALAIKRKGSAERVWCFLGDMTSETGMAQTSIRYAEMHQLPITFVIEDNGLSVLTETRTVWNSDELRFEENRSNYIRSFRYKSKYPHAGAGVRVQF